MLGREQPAVFARVAVGEGAVARERIRARAVAVEHRAQLASARETEVEGGADALCGQRQAVPGGVPDEEHVVLDGGPQLVGDPVALVALRRQVEVARQPDGRLLDMVSGPEGARADAQLIVGGEAPGVSGADVAGIDPQLHLLAAAGRVDLEAAREAGFGRLDRGRVGQHAPPAERVDDQRRGQIAAIGVDGEAVAAR